MRRVVVTGMGVISCLGNSKDAVIESLRHGTSGISFNEKFNEMGLRSQVCGSVDIDLVGLIDRKHKRFMGDAASYAYVALQHAIEDSGLDPEDVSNPRTGLIAGSGGASSANLVWGADKLREKGVRRVGPYLIPRTMSSTVSACLSTHFGILGLNYSVTSACATSTHCIGVAMEQIQWGKQDVVFAGGGEEEDWVLAMMFDAMGALSAGSNDNPSKASRAYDAARDGFVIAAGGGVLVLEELEHAKARGAKSMRRLSAMVRPLTGPIWWRLQARVRCAVCNRQWAPLRRR
jgi:3-oxoacyl-[acyl-carrier-protein] synthase-1